MCDCRCFHTANWSYDNQHDWTQYKNYYSVNKTPINVNTSVVIKDNNKISIHYSNKQLVYSIPNNKYIEYVCETEDSYLLYNNKKYILDQFHFHNSSENTKDGVYYPLECHFVHKYTDEITNDVSTLVIGLLFKISDINSSEITHNIVENFDSRVIFNLQIYNDLIKNKYYQFIGSLTVPPFTPNIIWNLFFYDDIENNIYLNISNKDYDNYLKFFSNNKANFLSYVNKNREALPLSNNFLALKVITPC